MPVKEEMLNSRHRLWSVCCWWLVYSLTWPESDWLDSGWVGLHTCGAWAIMAPRINQPSTHTLEKEPQPYHHEQHLPVSCVGGPQRKPLRWRVDRTNPATQIFISYFYNCISPHTKQLSRTSTDKWLVLYENVFLSIVNMFILLHLKNTISSSLNFESVLGLYSFFRITFKHFSSTT